MPYKRVLLKLSGEALMGEAPFGVSPTAVREVAERVRELSESGVQLALVCGGGNIFRGIQQGEEWGMERTPADQVGMLATLMNGVVLQRALASVGCDVRLLSAIDCPLVAERYAWTKAMRYLDEGKIVFFVGGSGHPYFTTDTASALRACEMKADIFLKATMRVDGVYDKDPRKHEGAKKFDQISFKEVLDRQLGIVDLSAVTMCMAENIPIRVFNFVEGSLLDAISEKALGTMISNKD